MNCNDCLQVLAVADVADAREIDAVKAHCDGCADCTRVLNDVRVAAVRVAEQLDAIPPGVASPLVARRAAAESAIRHQRGRRMRLIGYPLGAAALVAAVFGMREASGRQMGRDRPSRVFVPRCLMADQVGVLFQRRIDAPDVSISVSGGPMPMIRVWGPEAKLREAERLMAEYDNEANLRPGATCTIGPDAAGAAGATAAAAASEAALAEVMARQQEEIARQHEAVAREHERMARQQEAVERQQEAVERAREAAQRAREDAARAHP